MRRTTEDPKGIQWTLMEKLEDLDFADDIGLLAHRHQHMQEKTDRLSVIAKSTGLEINVNKTKNMRLQTRTETPITLNGRDIEEVDHFTYLGSVVNKKGGTDEDVKARISKARHAFVSLKPVWRNVNIRLNTKLRIFNSNVKSVLLYGSETWRETKTLSKRLLVFIQSCLRQILHIRWSDHVTNETVLQRTAQEPITTTIKRRKWRWVGHALRKDQNSISRRALDWNPQGHRKRGRPSATWKRSLEADLKDSRMTWVQAKREAQDRPRWRLVVEALCSTGNG